jgi:hypothetical protein|tara:strand:- start:2321 stop:3301 length:981 start_codon:yes stop_codon:yes gene_type:complete
MSRILKRPMFKRGGQSNDGIMSNVVDREQYRSGSLGIDRELLKKDTQTVSDLLSEFAPIPKTRLPIGDYGINLALGMDPVEALRDPYAKFTKADDIRRAQLTKRGQKALSTALNLQLAKAKQKPIIKARTLNADEIKKLNLPEGTVAQEKADGTINVVSKPDASTIKKRADLKSTIGLLNKVQDNYLALNKPVGGMFGVGFDFDRLKGQVGKFTGSEAGEKYSELLSDIDKTTTFLTQAISGAQVSEQEAERIRRLIPQITDTEVVFEAKLRSLRNYLAEATNNYGGDVEALMKAGVSAAEFYEKPKSKTEDLEIDPDGFYDLTIK